MAYLGIDLADREADLAAACAFLAARAPEQVDLLAELEAAHVSAAAALGALGPRPWRQALQRLRSIALGEGALEWLRDQELQLARRYTELGHPGAPGAWQRYLAAERLLLLYEFGELLAM
jgi:hypothetical protein